MAGRPLDRPQRAPRPREGAVWQRCRPRPRQRAAVPRRQATLRPGFVPGLDVRNYLARPSVGSLTPATTRAAGTHPRPAGAPGTPIAAHPARGMHSPSRRAPVRPPPLATAPDCSSPASAPCCPRRTPPDGGTRASNPPLRCPLNHASGDPHRLDADAWAAWLPAGSSVTARGRFVHRPRGHPDQQSDMVHQPTISLTNCQT